MPQDSNVLTEAASLIFGDRRDSYGDVHHSFQKIADGWAVIFGAKVSAKQVALAMVWLKLCRELNKPGRDNIVDLAGYTGLAGQLQELELVSSGE